MKQRKKNGFFNFIFSFIPGCMEMYSGFMRNGVSIMLLFVSTIILVIVTELDWLSFLPIVAYCYAFFHARSLSSVSADFYPGMQDVFIWDEFFGSNKTSDTGVSENGRKWIAGILIFIGGFSILEYIISAIVPFIPAMYWETLYPLVDNIPKVIVSIIIIVAGIVLICGKKKKKTDETYEFENYEPEAVAPVNYAPEATAHVNYAPEAAAQQNPGQEEKAYTENGENNDGDKYNTNEFNGDNVFNGTIEYTDKE